MRADDEDRAGAATKATAQAFYAASLFFDVARQFGELDAAVGRFSSPYSLSRPLFLFYLHAVASVRRPECSR